MKKIITIIMFVLLVATVSADPDYVCIDSDDSSMVLPAPAMAGSYGYDIYLKGSTYLMDTSVINTNAAVEPEWDYCASDDVLIEYICSDSMTVDYYQVACDCGCTQGACVECDEPDDDVPEFGFIGGLVALAGAGYFGLKKRK